MPFYSAKIGSASSVSFTAANHALMELQNQQIRAVIDLDPDFARFDDLIHVAREKKDQVKYELIAHTSEHGC